MSMTLGWYCFCTASNAFVIATAIFLMSNSAICPSRFTTWYIVTLLFRPEIFYILFNG